MSARTLSLAAAAALALASAGCGDGGDAKPLAPVRLALEAPDDRALVDGDSVEVRGRVWPADAQVRVEGEEVDAERGEFATTVALQPGTNLVDVVAGAHGRRSTMTVLRVDRLVDVTVPDVEGVSPEEAVRTLRQAGLDPRTHRSGGLLENLLPGSYGVCGTEPAAGERARPGSKIVVEYSKGC